jgi:hypothetical protein
MCGQMVIGFGSETVIFIARVIIFNPGQIAHHMKQDIGKEESMDGYGFPDAGAKNIPFVDKN